MVGAQAVRAGAVGKEVGLLFFDAVFHVAARAVVGLVERRGVGVVFGQVGDDEARVGAFEEVFGFGDDATRALQEFWVR